MNAKQSHNTVDREELIYYITTQINAAPDQVYELSSTDLAKHFGVQSPTMDYHLKRLLNDGVFVVLSKKGKYGRKLYTLPGSKPIINDLESFKSLLKNKFDTPKKEEVTNVDVISNSFSKLTKDKTEEKEQQSLEQEQEVTQQEETKTEPKVAYDIGNAYTKLPQQEETVEVEVSNLTLNEQIQAFLNKTKSIPRADQLISIGDKEILSVMAESIQQQQVYLTDLSNQLKLAEDLKLLHKILEDREKMVAEMDQMRKEHAQILAAATESQNNVAVDPQRVRLMHQVIINTLDTYLELPNQSLATQRIEFRNNITKDVSNLANYILGLEK